MPFPADPCPECPREAHGWPPPCPAQLQPERDWCRYARDWDDSEAVAFLCGRGSEPGESAAPKIPLAGDLIAIASRRLGADRLARWVAARLGADCGCEARRIKINALDAKLRKYLGIGG